MKWRDVPSFERLPIDAIIRRNWGRRSLMLAALVPAAEGSILRGDDRLMSIEVMREAIRPFDLYSHKKGDLQ